MESKMSNEQIKGYVENEGLGYAIESGIGADSIEDVQLAEMWKQANHLLGMINEHLGIDL